jgi:hypothetical protein
MQIIIITNCLTGNIEPKITFSGEEKKCGIFGRSNGGRVAEKAKMPCLRSMSVGRNLYHMKKLHSSLLSQHKEK